MNDLFVKFAALAFGIVATVAPAQAAMVGTSDCNAMPILTSVSSAACWGSSTAGSTASTPGMVVTGSFDTAASAPQTGMFGKTDWLFAERWTWGGGAPQTPGAGVGLQVNSRGSDGTWDIDHSAVAAFDQVMVVFTDDDAVSAYLFDNLQGGGAWLGSLQGSILDDVTVYVRGAATQVVPLPAGIVLLLGALGGLGIVARRRAAVAA